MLTVFEVACLAPAPYSLFTDQQIQLISRNAAKPIKYQGTGEYATVLGPPDDDDHDDDHARCPVKNLSIFQHLDFYFSDP